MDRNVYARDGFGLDKAVPTQPSPKEKLLKLFPAEALALYSTLKPLMATKLVGHALAVALWSVLLVSVVFCALYLKRFWKVEHSSQIAISCSALVLYVAALGAPSTPSPTTIR